MNKLKIIDMLNNKPAIPDSHAHSQEINTFEYLGTGRSILKALKKMGIETPTKIQTAAIPVIFAGKDVAGQAHTGTGKTVAFAIPVLQKINSSLPHVQALIMCPTRELAIQITGEFIKLSEFMPKISVTPLYGGQPIQRQISRIKQGTQVIVGTPGRVIDHLKRKTLNLDQLNMVVLDEADEMLNMGFREDIETILEYSPGSSAKQTIMFSATISKQIRDIMKRWFNQPEMICVDDPSTSADGIRQFLVEVRDSMRTEGICRIMDMNDYRLALIFCNTRRTCDTLINDIQARGYSADVLHGEMSQTVRDRVMKKFRQRQIDILVATDVAARGLDVDDIDVVFNYDIPQDPEYYVHRIGRTGRAGRTGAAYTFAAASKSRSIRHIEKKLSLKLNVIPLPSVSQVEVYRRNQLLSQVVQLLEKGGLRPYIDQIESILDGKFTPVEAAAALLKMSEHSGGAAESKRYGGAAESKRSGGSYASKRSGRSATSKRSGKPASSERSDGSAGSRSSDGSYASKRSGRSATSKRSGKPASSKLYDRPASSEKSGDKESLMTRVEEKSRGKRTKESKYRKKTHVKKNTEHPFYSRFVKKKSKKKRQS